MSTIIYLAPMQGVGDAIYRNTWSRFFTGCAKAVASYITTKQGQPAKAYRIKDIMPENNKGLPLVPQILSKEPADFIVLAEFLFDLGYAEINWNLGCPFPSAVLKKRGAGLLPHRDLIERFLETVLNKIPNRLSIKTRLGFKHNNELLALIPLLNNYPLTELIIHPRIGQQRFAGTVDLDMFAQCLPACRHPVTYNGDIWTLADHTALAGRFPAVDRWMLGRGVLANPWLPSMIRQGDTLSWTEKLARLKLFHDALLDGYRQVLFGPGHVLDRMKGHWYYLRRSFTNGEAFYKKITRARKYDLYQDLTNTFFTEQACSTNEKL